MEGNSRVEVQGLFQKKENPQVDLVQLSRTVGDLARRVRTLEERFEATRERLDIVDDSVHDSFTQIKDDINDINVKVSELSNIIEELKVTLQQIIKQLSVFARKSDMLALEKYVDLMDPSRYLTKDEILELIKSEKVNKK